MAFYHLFIVSQWNIKLVTVSRAIGAPRKWQEEKNEDVIPESRQGGTCDCLASHVVTQPAFARWHERIGGCRKVSLRVVISGMGVSASFPCVFLSHTDNLWWIICNWRWIPRPHGKGECCKCSLLFQGGNYRPAGWVGVRACVSTRDQPLKQLTRPPAER